MKINSKPFFLVFFIGALLLDRVTKNMALAYLPERSDYAGGFHIFALYRNYGMTFGMFEDNPSVCLALALCGFLLFVFFIIGSGKAFWTPGTALLLAGALGNLADRFVYGYVIDWLHVFVCFVYMNLADVWLCVGVLLVIARGRAPWTH